MKTQYITVLLSLILVQSALAVTSRQCVEVLEQKVSLDGYAGKADTTNIPEPVITSATIPPSKPIASWMIRQFWKENQYGKEWYRGIPSGRVTVEAPFEVYYDNYQYSNRPEYRDFPWGLPRTLGIRDPGSDKVTVLEIPNNILPTSDRNFVHKFSDLTVQDNAYLMALTAVRTQVQDIIVGITNEWSYIIWVRDYKAAQAPWRLVSAFNVSSVGFTKKHKSEYPPFDGANGFSFHELPNGEIFIYNSPAPKEYYKTYPMGIRIPITASSGIGWGQKQVSFKDYLAELEVKKAQYDELVNKYEKVTPNWNFLGNLFSFAKKNPNFVERLDDVGYRAQITLKSGNKITLTLVGFYRDETYRVSNLVTKGGVDLKYVGTPGDDIISHYEFINNGESVKFRLQNGKVLEFNDNSFK